MKWRLDPGQIEVVDEAVAAVLRTKTPAERIAIAADAFETARAMTTARVREQHPSWDPEQVSREVARRLTRGSN